MIVENFIDELLIGDSYIFIQTFDTKECLWDNYCSDWEGQCADMEIKHIRIDHDEEFIILFV